MKTTTRIEDLLIAAGTETPPGSAMHECWSQWATAFTAAGAFTHLAAEDAPTVAALITAAYRFGDEGRELRRLAAALTSGQWAGWATDPAAVAHALNVVALVAEAL